MNIVKGVADLLRRSSSSYGSDSRSGSSFERFSPPTPLIRFSESGDEAILSALWARYENVSDKDLGSQLYPVSKVETVNQTVVCGVESSSSFSP
nr:BEACH domain-containing protein B isoform X1 [Ipomoea batatas]